ncbi:MAG: FAD-dependent oxidoreductase, partial [Clostridia bacterium]|nr:FAD-dependent oxidoreductase [Clostridia bacterium]
MQYDVIIIGAGPGGIFSAYELMLLKPELKVAVFEAGHALNKRHCPIDGDKVKSCIKCKSCSIMSGFGGAGAFSDGKYNITNDFGGTLYEYIGKKQALDLMRYVDEINMRFGGEGTKLYSTAGTRFKTLCIQHDLHLLDASVRHLGTDINYIVLENLYAHLKDKVDFFFDTPVQTVEKTEEGYAVLTESETYSCRECVISVGRIGSKWMEKVCKDLDIPTESSRVDIGVRVELPAQVFAHLTDELYESKIVYRTENYGDRVRTFCMTPKGAVVN